MRRFVLADGLKRTLLSVAAALGAGAVAIACNADAQPIDSLGHPDHLADAGVEGLAEAGTATNASGVDAGTALQDLGQDQQQQVASKLVERLTEPEVVDALCTVAGVTAGSNAGLSCEAIIDSCQQTFGQNQDAAVGGLNVPLAIPADAQPLSNCPATVAQLDSCLAELVDIFAQAAEGLSCDSSPEAGVVALAPEQLLGAPNCLVLFLLCPELASALIPN